MKTLFLITTLSVSTWAQTQDNFQGTFLHKKLEALNTATYQVAGNFANDSRFDVTEYEDQIVIKKRTEPTTDPVAIEELTKIENLQQLFHFSFGFSSNSTPRRYFDKFSVKENVRIYSPPTLDLEFAVRPPVKGLKRLAVGYGAGMYKNDPPDVSSETQTLIRGGRQMSFYHSGFATWDVLVLRKARAFVSPGYKIGLHRVSDLMDGNTALQTKQVEHSGTIRWTQYLGREPGGPGAQLFIQYGRSQLGNNIVTAGFTYTIGPDWPFLKRTKTK